METLGKQIKTLRERGGLTQEDLAEQMEVSRQAVSKWEADLSRPSTGNLVRLAALLGVGLDRLTGLTAREEAAGRTPEERSDASAEADGMTEEEPDGLNERLPAAGLITPPSVRRARAFPWLALCGAVAAVFVIGSLILAMERGPRSTPSSSSPENTPETVEFPARISLTASPCRDFLNYGNAGDAVAAADVGAGLLLEYRFPDANTSIAFYRAYAGSGDEFGRPLYHLWAAYTLDGQSYTAMARLAEDDPAAGSPALSAYEALGFSGCRLSYSVGDGSMGVSGAYYFTLEEGIPQILFSTDDPCPRETDVDADGENEIVTLGSTGGNFIFDRGVDDYTAYALEEPLQPGWTLRHDGTDFYLDGGGGSAAAYHHLWAGALTQDEVRGTDYTMSGLYPDVEGTVITFVSDQFSDGIDPDAFRGRDQDGDPLPTHRQLARIGLQTLFDLTGIRLERCYALATEFGVYYALDRNFDRRSFYGFDGGRQYGGGELTVAGFDLTWNGEGTEWSPLLPEEAARPEGPESPEGRALWVYARAPLLQTGEIVRTGGGLGDDVRLYLEDGRFFEISTNPETGLAESCRGPYPQGFEH